MGYTIYAKSIAEDILKELDTSNKVHSMFDNGINITAKDNLIFVGTDKNGTLPFGIHLEDKDIKLLTDINMGEIFIYERDKEILMSEDKKIKINLDKAHRHTIKLPKNKDLITIDSLEVLLNKVKDMDLQTGLDISTNEILKGKEPVLEDLDKVMISKDSQYIELKLRKIIGRGKGLTPSGDDILIGLIWLNDIREILSNEFLEALNILIENEELTTAVSINYYIAAFKGSYGGLLIDLCESLIKGSKESIEKSIETMTKLGHSSGIDTLTGISLGISKIINRGL